MQRGRVRLVLVLLVCGLAVPSPSAGGAAVENGTILIVEAPHHGDPGGSWTVQPDGSGRRLLPKAARSYPVEWSPDGRQLAFLCAAGVCRTWADGTQLRVVFRGRGVTEFDWSPEGKRLVVLSRAGRDVIVVPATGGRASVLHRLVGLPASAVAWSPDGSQLALVRNGIPGRQRGQVCVMAAKRTTQLDCLAPTPRGSLWISPPSWSADSRTFVFSASAITAAGVSTSWIHRFDPRTRAAVRLRQGGAPQLSPDGTAMAFLRTGVDISIHLLDLASGREQMLATGGTFAWAPRGDAIACFADGGVAVVSVADGTSKLVFREVFTDPYSISWAVKPT